MTDGNIAIVASTGDVRSEVQSPASLRVGAVAGTTLNLNADNTYLSEAIWNGTGSGCSAYFSAQVWQTAAPGWM